MTLYVLQVSAGSASPGMASGSSLTVPQTQGQPPTKQQPNMERKRSITSQLLMADGGVMSHLPLITNIDAEVNAPLTATNRLLQGEDLLQALDIPTSSY